MTPGEQDQQAEGKYRKWRTRAFQTWTLVGICILAGIVIYICNILWQAVAVLIVTALAVFLLHGIVQHLQDRGLPRVAAVTITFLVVSAVIIGCIVIFIPMLVQQLASLVSHMPEYAAQLQDFLKQHSGFLGDDSNERVSQALASFSTWVQQQAGNIVSSAATGVIGVTMGVGNVVVIAFISLLCSFWILLDLPKLVVEVRSLFSESFQDDLDNIGNAFGTAIYGWARSTLVCALLTGIASGLTFWAMGIPYAAVLGFIGGVLYLVPYLGSMITCAIVFVISLFVSIPVAIGSIVANVIIHNLVGNVISPRLMESSVNVHPALVLLAILIGGALAGVAGMLLFIPLVAAIQTLFITYYEARTGKKIATEDGALFKKPADRRKRGRHRKRQ